VLLAGAGEWVECGDADTGGLVALSVECWCRPDVVGTGNRPLVSKYDVGNDSDGNEWALYVTRDGRVYFVAWDVSGGVSAGWTAVGALGERAWRHVRGCYDAVAARVRVFLDGVDVTEDWDATGNAVQDTAQPVRLGGHLADAEIGFVGAMGPVRICSVCRSAYSVIPVTYPPVDGQTVGQWNLAGNLVNAKGDAALDGRFMRRGKPGEQAVSATPTWTHMPIIALKRTVVERRADLRAALDGRAMGLRLWPRTAPS
jgi:hypothetical protein